MSLRQLLNAVYVWLLEGRDLHARQTVDDWLAGKPLLPRGHEQGSIDELIAMAALPVG